MSQLVLAFLGIAWVAVLAPDAARLLRPRRSGTASVDQFRRQLDSLGRSAPAAVSISRQPPRRQSRGAFGRRVRHRTGQVFPQHPAKLPGLDTGPHSRRRGRPLRRWSSPATSMPTTPQEAAGRRRDISTLLALCVLVALAGTLVSRSPWTLVAFVVMLVLTVGYAVLALRRRCTAPSADVHYLPRPRLPSDTTVTMIRRSAKR